MSRALALAAFAFAFAGCGERSSGPSAGDAGTDRTGGATGTGGSSSGGGGGGGKGGAGPSVNCVLNATYVFGQTGGHVRYEDAVTLTPPSTYQHLRRTNSGTTADISCSPSLPTCHDAAALDVADVLRDIADPDVQRALEAATPPLYGSDPRPIDGSIFSFLRADGRGFLAGGACGSTGSGVSCIAVPAGVARLVTNLRALDLQQLNDATCAPLRVESGP